MGLCIDRKRKKSQQENVNTKRKAEAKREERETNKWKSDTHECFTDGSTLVTTYQM
jgi:hypothetical protein